ncbi:MAG: hypothetical protein AAFX50_08880, partial [Acidobacteriota bacterium]
MTEAARWAAPFLALAILGLLTGCGEKAAEGPPPLVDLVAFFADSEVQLPTTEIRFGDPQARRQMVSGFHPARRKLQSERFAAWTIASGAEVEFFVDTPQPLEMTFRCAPVPREGEELPTVTLSVGGKTIFEQQLERGFKVHTVQVPAAALVHGENRLKIDHPRVAPDARRAGRDTQVIWDWLRFNQAPSEPPRAEAEEQTILVSTGSRVDYFLDLPANARLDVERVVTRSHDGPFRVRWEPLEGPPIEQDLVRSERARVALTGAEPASGRLSLSAPGTEPRREPARGGVILVAPTIALDAAAPEPASAATAGLDAALEG